ncbi:vWA domain-containing protein [Vibrio astriarenae]|uniref:vWA domain-containing protein n=1 Tax=Vibrio astriarenae TaxID=1481923 RepID=UPI003736BE83
MMDYALLTQFHFLRPEWLWALLPISLLVAYRFRMSTQPKWIDILPTHLRKALTIGEQGWKRQLPLKLLALLMSLATIIAAGPTWQREPSPFGEDKAALVIVLDVSESMLETDVAPSRLTRAKQKIRDLLAIRGGGRNALVVYAGSAHLTMPLTQDIAVFTPFLDAIEPSVMPVAGKNLIATLPIVQEIIQRESGGSVLVVTDQVSESTIRSLEASGLSANNQVIALGIGNPNSVSQNPANLDSLKQLSSALGGHYLEVSIDDSDIRQINRYIERNMALNGDSAMPWKDMGYYLVYPLALFMLLWFRKGWLVQWSWALVLLPTILITQQVKAESVSLKAQNTEIIKERTLLEQAQQWWISLWLTPDQQAQWLFNDKQYLAAAARFEEPLRKGIAFYYGNDYQRAYNEFVQLETPRARIYAANALARQREYVKARDSLKALLEQTDLSDELRQQAEVNYQVISSIVDEVNRMSESQIGMPDGPEQSTELADDEPQTGDGVDEETTSDFINQQTLSAEQILSDSEIADKWLKGVEADPKRFLRAKFQIQHLQREEL